MMLRFPLDAENADLAMKVGLEPNVRSVLWDGKYLSIDVDAKTPVDYNNLTELLAQHTLKGA